MAVPYKHIREPEDLSSGAGGFDEEELPIDPTTAYSLVLSELIKENDKITKPLLSNQYVKPDKRWGKKIKKKEEEEKKKKKEEEEETPTENANNNSSAKKEEEIADESIEEEESEL